MSKTIAVTISDDVKEQIDAVSSADGVPQDEVIRRAVEEYLFTRRFRELRGKMMSDLESRGIRLTDEDVFEAVS